EAVLFVPGREEAPGGGDDSADPAVTVHGPVRAHRLDPGVDQHRLATLGAEHAAEYAHRDIGRCHRADRDLVLVTVDVGSRTDLGDTRDARGGPRAGGRAD